jgi:SAM-dependent methyltransferase
MEIYQESIPDIERYIRNHNQGLEYYRPQFDGMRDNLERFYKIEAGKTKILEIGCGTGWVPIFFRREGFDCEGLEISWQLRDYADKQAREIGLDSSGIRVGNIETDEIGENRYDVIMANQVFEHVEHWRPALKKVYNALRPGGAFQFSSTNKFCLVSGEHWFPFYGWFPDKPRYALRRMFDGPEIMKLGIDFNQFRYPLLERVFKEIGYSKVYDRVDHKEPSEFTGMKSLVLSAAKNVGIVRSIVRTFDQATVITCIK